LKFGELVAALALVAAVLALLMALLVQNFTVQPLKGYEPKDLERGKHLEKREASR
jgi:hypothetical protein